MVSFCKLLGVRSFILEVGSWSVMMLLQTSTKTNVILCPDKKGQGPEAQLLPSEVQALAKRRGSLHGLVTLPGSICPAPSLGPPTSAQAWLRKQISAGSRDDPAQPSSLREPGAQDPAGPQAPQAAQNGGGSGSP